MPRVVLVLPTTTYRAADFVDAAAALGADVVVASDQAPVLAAADRAVAVDLSDPDALADALSGLDDRVPVDAVVAVDDRGVVAAAAAAARLGLAHNPPEAAARTRDKAALRRALDGAEVPQPAFRLLVPGDDPSALGFPAVLKPLDRSGSQGVIRVDDPPGAAAAADRIRSIVGDPAAPLLLERFVPGPEIAVEAVLRAGSLDVLAVFDKPDALDGPYFEETIYVTPSRHPAGEVAEAVRTTERACAALGLVEGPVHAELRLAAAGPVVIEVAARSIGGLCARALRFGAGVALEEVILRHALGMPTDGLRREAGAAGVAMLPIPASGVLREVRGVAAASAVPGVAGVELTVVPGRPVQALPEGDRYLGFAFARGATPHQVETSLRTALDHLEVVIDPA